MAEKMADVVARGAAPRPGAKDDLARLTATLNAHRERVDVNPHANPVKLLAYNILQEMLDGTLDDAATEALVRRLSARAFVQRAERMRTYLGGTDVEANRGRVVEALIGKLGGDLDLAAFKALVGRVWFGFVVTAHPTFSQSLDSARDLVALAFQADPDGAPLDDAALKALLARVEARPHRPEADLGLDVEHRWSMVAIRNLRAAVRELYGWVYDLAVERFGEAAALEVAPRLVSVASWVGYDTDGRSDIGWTVTFAKRMAVQADQLRHYREGIQNVAALDKGADLADVLELIEARLSLAIQNIEDEGRGFATLNADAPDFETALADLARRMVGGGGRRLNDAEQLAVLIERALAAAGTPEARRALFVLRAEVETQGLVAARTHVRINAVQLHNAIRKTIKMEHAADDPSYRASYQQTVNGLIERATPAAINFGTLAAERATAPRAFMLIGQMHKHLDASEPVRFLIAECETPLTLLTALYYAKRVGVDGQVDISPLFETQKALERGVEIVEGALEFAPWRDYLRRRGRMYIQTGFSDAGRYIGQPAAAYMIERLRLNLADLFARHGLEDVKLVIFDTHGESIGRGAHPTSMADRFRYYGTTESRRRFAEAGVKFVQETSFQGGDGYLWFLGKKGALATVCRAVEHVLTPIDMSAEPDPFYAQALYVDEFFAAVRQFNARAIDDPCYATFLGAFGVNLLYPTGSRAMKRQSGTAEKPLSHPSQIRAIPHNAILQQLGVLANTIGGVGQAVDKNPERFHGLYRESPRFRRLLSMVENAFMFTDLDVVQAYVDLFDPGLWLRRAQVERDRALANELRAVADFVERIDLHDRLQRMVRAFARDYTDLARALREHRRLTRETGDKPIAIDEATRDDLHVLHALRLALIQSLMLKAIHIPDFSDRHATTHDELVMRLMRLDVEGVLTILGEIFPLTPDMGRLDYGEPATYGDGTQSYAVEHETLFRPIGRRYDLVRRIGSGIVHHVGAFG